MTEHEYQATHKDLTTVSLRAFGWNPPIYMHCGCQPTRLCEQHAAIRAAEHYHPELAR